MSLSRSRATESCRSSGTGFPKGLHIQGRGGAGGVWGGGGRGGLWGGGGGGRAEEKPPAPPGR
ncbi:hypothetical protein, partial [Nocardia abscessus]|uniref:hypothetical protein n=1 Tax=Nocardia abscessus TaxID=120957 RepID=UPI00245828AE